MLFRSKAGKGIIVILKNIALKKKGPKDSGTARNAVSALINIINNTHENQDPHYRLRRFAMDSLAASYPYLNGNSRDKVIGALLNLSISNKKWVIRHFARKALARCSLSRKDDGVIKDKIPSLIAIIDNKKESRNTRICAARVLGSLASGMEKSPYANLLTNIGYRAEEIATDMFSFKDMKLIYSNKELDRKSTRLNSSHTDISRMPSSA